jgi:hypothetical protein
MRNSLNGIDWREVVGGIAFFFIITWVWSVVP